MDGVITITTAEQLAALAVAANGGNNYSGVTIKLGADLDLNGDNYSWTPIGTNYSNPFAGTFDGDGHTISNLKINSDKSVVGLFSCVDGTIQNVNLNNVNVSSSGPEYVGGLVGRTHHNGNTKIENCTVSGTVSGTGNYTMNVGGIAGNNSGTVSNCTFNGTVSGISSVGGLVGNNYGPISGSTTIATVSGMSAVGGLSGRNFSNISGNTVIATVNVSGTGEGEYLGGISGTNQQATVTSGTISGTVSGNYYYSNWSNVVDYIDPNAENVSDNKQLYKLTVPSGVEATATGTGNKVVADNGNYYAAGTVTLKASDSTAVIKSTSYTNSDDGTVSVTPTADTNISSNDIAFYYKLTLQGVTVDSGTGYGGNYSDYYTGTVTLAAKTSYNLSQTSLTVTKAETITATLASGVYVFSTDNGTTYQLATADNVKSNNYPDLQQAYQLTLPSGVTAADGVITAGGNYYMIPNSEVTLTIGTGAALVGITDIDNVAADSSGQVKITPTADVTVTADNLYYAVDVPNCAEVSGTSATIDGTTYYQNGSTLNLTAKTGYVLDNTSVTVSTSTEITATVDTTNHYAFSNGDGYTYATDSNVASNNYPDLVQVYALTLSDGVTVTGDKVATDSDGKYYAVGSVTLTAAAGYTLQNVTVDGTTYDGNTLTVNADTKISADSIKFNNVNISTATGATVGGTTGNLSTFNGVYSISASQDDSTLTGNAKNNTIILNGGGENILTGGSGNDTYKFKAGGGIVTDYGIGATKDGAGEFLSPAPGSDVLKVDGKVSGVYFDRAASNKNSANFTAVVTYDSDDDSIADQVVVLKDIIKKPTKYGSKPVYQTNDVAAATMKIWDTSGSSGKQAVISAAKLKKLFRDDDELSTDLLKQVADLGKLDGIGELNLPAVDRLSPSNTQATYSGSND